MSQIHSDAWRRRHAMALAAQLPEAHEDAVAVLKLMEELIAGFMNGSQEPRRGLVVALPTDCGNSPSRLARSSGKASVRPL